MKNNVLPREELLSIVEYAAMSDPDELTGDRIEALAGGHGMLNLSVYTVANVIIEELEQGGHLDVQNANTKKLPMETILEKCVRVCKEGGCDAANAALISAVMMYIAGTKAQVGVPAGNRKLGALARMIAGNDRCGVANIPTAKSNNKLSGFPAVAAVYQAMAEGKLTEIDGDVVPGVLLGSVMFGHNALGEDIVFPQLAKNGAHYGTLGMMKAYRGAGMHYDPFTCALFGAAAILEIIHPDASVSEEIGPYGKITSAFVAGQSAAKTAGLPDKLHIRGTNEEYDTGMVIGDLALILKDIGGPSVIGMMALNEIVSVFKEGIAGGSGARHNVPLGHMCGYAVVLMKALMYFQGDTDKAVQVTLDDRIQSSFNPEYALTSINLTARKAHTMHRGKVTDLLIKGTDPYVHHLLHHISTYAYERLQKGDSLGEVVAALEKEKMTTVETNAARIFSAMKGEPVSIHILQLHGGSRRTSKMAMKYIAFDAYIDVEITCGEKHVLLKGLLNDIIPKIARGEITDLDWALDMVIPVCSDPLFGGSHMMNIVIPSAVAVLLHRCGVEEAADEATKAGVISAGMPGGKPRIRRVANLALQMERVYQ